MFTKQFKLALTTVIVASIVVTLTFAPSRYAYACWNEVCSCDSEEDDPIINPDCPNGCVLGGNRCFCFKEYLDLREYRWP